MEENLLDWFDETSTKEIEEFERIGPNEYIQRRNIQSKTDEYGNTYYKCESRYISKAIYEELKEQARFIEDIVKKVIIAEKGGDDI